MTRNIQRWVVPLLATLVILGGLPAVAVAQQTGADATGPDTASAIVRIDEGETYDGTLDVSAGAVVVAGTVDGDVSAAAGSVLVTGTGRVTGDLEATAGSVLLEGTVDGNVTVGSAALELREGSQVGGDLDAGAADVRLDGRVDGDVAVDSAALTVGPTATVGGSLTYTAEDPTLADGASVAGDVTRDEDLAVASPDVFGGDGGPSLPAIPWWVGGAYAVLTNLLLGAVLLAGAPAFSQRLTEIGTTRAVRSGGIGLLTLVGTPIALLFLLVTIVGIPLSIVGLLVFVAVVWVASVYGAVVAGTWLLSLGDYHNRWAALLVGVVAVAVASRVPLVGGLARLVVLLVGLGAFVAALLELREREATDDEASSEAAVAA